MFGGSKQEQLEHRLDHKLNASSDGIDMDVMFWPDASGNAAYLVSRAGIAARQ